MKKLLLIITFLFSLFSSAQVYVDINATGANDGTSWVNAYNSLQTAISNAVQNDEIWIAAGTYSPGTSRNDTFNITANGISIYGGFNGTETMLGQRDASQNIVVLSGDVNGNDTGTLGFNTSTRQDNNIHVVTISSSSNTLIDGVTIAGGQANDTSNPTNQEGAAILIGNGNATISNCIITENVVTRAGVIQKLDRTGNLDIINTRFHDNFGNSATLFYGRANGGTMNVRFINCLMDDNITQGVSAPNRSGLIWFRQDVSATVNATMINCTVVDNRNTTATQVAELVSASRLSGGTNNMEVYNSIFYSNTYGANNSNMNSIAGHPGQNPANTYIIKNSIDEDSFSLIVDNGSTRIKVNTSNANPQFVSNTDFNLLLGSPAINTGDISDYPISVAIDIAGNARVQSTSIDLGAYESPFMTAPPTLNVRYVNPNATGNNDGSSWTDAYTDLKSALVNDPGSEFWVVAGTYSPGNNRTDFFSIPGDGTRIYGGFIGNEMSRTERDFRNNPTILSADVNDDDTGPVVYQGQNRDENNYGIMKVGGKNVTVDGITFYGGQATGSASNLQLAAAIEVQNENFTTSNCIFRGNAGSTGGLITALDQTGSLNIYNCEFSDNLGRLTPLVYSRAASGSNYLVTISNCLIRDNQKVGIGGTDSVGLFWFRQDNSGNQQVVVSNCTIVNNTANVTGMNTTVFSSSQVTGLGDVQLSVHNSIFNNNTNLSFANSLLTSLGNGSNQNNGSLYQVTHSISDDNFFNISNNGNNFININTSNQNPLFTSVTDFTLQANCPAIDTGDNSRLRAVVNTDFLGNVRIANNIVDMGAYEFGSTASLEEVKKLNVKLYPVPARDVLNVELNDSAFAKAYIYNLQGQQVATSTESRVVVANLKSGMYLIQIETTDGAVASQQFIKK